MSLIDKEIEIITDVTVRFIAHDNYKTINGAITSLKKRLENYSLSVCEEIFKQSVKVYKESEELIKTGKFINPPDNKIASLDDIDFENSLNYLSLQNDTVDNKLIISILNWTIYWYYLK